MLLWKGTGHTNVEKKEKHFANGAFNAILVVGGNGDANNWVGIRSGNWRANGKSVRCIAQY